jgi:hypothetical protein
MKILAQLALSVPLLLSLSFSPASALTVPERLVYDISWTGIKAGTAVQEVTSQGGELRIVSTAHSAGWLNSFFKVDDRTESVLHRGTGAEMMGTPKFYREKINEGKTHTLKEAQFDHPRLNVNTKDFLKNTEKNHPISAKTFDSLSCIYFVRSSELVLGKSIFIDIYDCKRLWNTEVQVVRREEIGTPLGRFKTIVVKPLLKSEGFFARTGEVMVWLTDDSLRIPVKMTTKLKLGSITAELVGGSYWPKGEPDAATPVLRSAQ